MATNKIIEAQARKKFKQAQRLEKLKKKADILAGDEVRSCPLPLLFARLGQWNRVDDDEFELTISPNREYLKTRRHGLSRS